MPKPFYTFRPMLALSVLTGISMLSGCNNQAAYYNSTNSSTGSGTFVAGPNSDQGKLLPPVNLPFAGMYPISRTVTVNNTQVTEQDYLYISSSGVITTYVDQNLGNYTPSQNCYKHANATTPPAPNAILEQAQLYETSDSAGNIYYHTTVNGNDIGLAQVSSSNGNANLEVYLNGTLQANSAKGVSTYTLSNGDVLILGGAPTGTISQTDLTLCSA